MHHNRGRKGLGFVTKRTVYLVNRKYVGLAENIVCFHCGKRGIIGMHVHQEGMPWIRTWFM